MTNPNAPFGLRVSRHKKGGVVRESEYQIASAYGTALYLGDPVVCTGTGTNIQIASAAASAKITGVFAGCKYVNVLGDTIFSKHWPAATVLKTGTVAIAFVIDDPDVLFYTQFDALVAANVRAFANLVAGAGNAQTGQSGWSAAQPPGSTENQVKIMEVPPSLVNMGGVPNAYGAYAVAEILIGQHELVGNLAAL